MSVLSLDQFPINICCLSVFKIAVNYHLSANSSHSLVIQTNTTILYFYYFFFFVLIMLLFFLIQEISTDEFCIICPNP